LKDKKQHSILTKVFKIFILSFCLFCQSRLNAQVPEFWYEYQLKQMSLDEKIGQLFMVAAYSNKDAQHTLDLENQVLNYHVGGLVFFQNDPLKQAYLSNYLQSISKVPLMLGIDAEWGLAMRLQHTQKFPYAITLGALQKDSLAFEIGAAIGRDLKRLGMHINFAPDVDINVNPKNPIIGFRAFGDDKKRISFTADAFSKGMLSEDVLSCAKHFPGHGDVHTDSHLDMPEVDKSYQQLDTSEFYPFKYLIQQGVPSIMVAHIFYPQLDSRPNRPASLSKHIIDTVLRQKMNFDGLVITDALNMKGVSKYYEPGFLELEAFLAGNDVLMFSENVPKAFELIKDAILKGLVSEAELDRRVTRILKWKKVAGLDQYKPIETSHLLKDLNSNKNDNLLQSVANQTVEIVRDPQDLIRQLENSKTVFVTVGDLLESSWKTEASAHGFSHFISMDKDANAEKQGGLLNKLGPYSTVVISLHQAKFWKQEKAGYTENDFALIKLLAKKKKVIVVGFCNPYVLQYLPDNVTVVAGYEDLPYFHHAVLDLITGKITQKGKLPIKLRTYSNANESTGSIINTNKLNEIDGIVQQLMQKKAAPGCRVLVLREGKEVFNRSYGYLNYDKLRKVNDSSMYDIASVTKIAATTLAVMKLYEEGKIDLQKTLGHYLPQVQGSNKADLVLSEILQHRAGLTAWIPFYKETLPYIDSIYCAIEDSAFCVKVADKLFMLKANKDTIYKRIFDSPLEAKVYRYSDLSMILMQLVVEKVSGKSLDQYVDEKFYKPIGLKYITYNPWKKQKTDNIAPTQSDRLFRQQELCGYVHDPGAAMLGGVSGHAGIFSTASDLAALMQMLVQGGNYNGKEYLKLSTIKKFTSYQNLDSRRGLGFDKPDFTGKISPASTLGSHQMFGHTGFTGTCTWADPKSGLVFVFLSNRICPIEENKELITGNYRTRIQDVIYLWLSENN
jgi:beta-glucosidase-like glycosyl hydrolase/CubicO group peptidase (beta-lactamase class C family)